MSFSKKFTLMDAFDDAMFSMALQDAFPQVIFMAEYVGVSSPDDPLPQSIPECGGEIVCVYFPEHELTPEFTPLPYRKGRWKIKSPPSFELRYIRSNWFWGQAGGGRWAFSPPTLNETQMSIRHDKSDKEQRQTVNKIWKTLRTVTTNKLKTGRRKDEFVSASGSFGSAGPRAGFHAIDWCRQAPDRMLDGLYMPCDDWEWPDDPYVQELRQRVIERFGPDFGKEPPEPGPKDPINRVIDRCWEGLDLPHLKKV